MELMRIAEKLHGLYNYFELVGPFDGRPKWALFIGSYRWFGETMDDLLTELPEEIRDVFEEGGE